MIFPDVPGLKKYISINRGTAGGIRSNLGKDICDDLSLDRSSFNSVDRNNQAPTSADF